MMMMDAWVPPFALKTARLFLATLAGDVKPGLKPTHFSALASLHPPFEEVAGAEVTVEEVQRLLRSRCRYTYELLKEVPLLVEE